MDLADYLKERYGGERIGKSALGKDILCVHRGAYSGVQIIITAAIHARECYTALVAAEQMDAFEYAGDGGVYFIPLVNPDGARFFERGDAQGSAFLAQNAALHTEWKANADGVDLNCNFPARWGTGAGNVTHPAPHGFIGDYPLCAPESRALAEFTKAVKPALTVSYHAMGGELYWEFFQSGAARQRDENTAKAIAEHIRVKKVDGDLNSAGGYKDWCVSELGIPSVTVELVHSGAHPLTPRDFAEDIRFNADLPQFILKMLSE